MNAILKVLFIWYQTLLVSFVCNQLIWIMQFCHKISFQVSWPDSSIPFARPINKIISYSSSDFQTFTRLQDLFFSVFEVGQLSHYKNEVPKIHINYKSPFWKKKKILKPIISVSRKKSTVCDTDRELYKVYIHKFSSRF